ncbi:MAG: DUF1638 domain-containing protein [Ilumatobacteraceae bacterium]
MNRPLVLACGALVAELRAVLAADALTEQIDVRYLPANLHNRPHEIAPAIAEALAEADPDHTRPVLVAYADCGTGGALDRLLDGMPNARRLPGAHCYEFFAGTALFAALHDAEPGTFYLTDFLAKHFDALVWQGLGLDRHPQLRDTYFGHYTRVVLLSQADGAALDTVLAAGHEAAARLGLRFEHHHVGLTPFAIAIGKVA